MTNACVVEASGTVGNFGPGFDVLSLALADVGDTIHLRVADEDRIQLTGPDAAALPTAWESNVAGVTLDALRATTGIDDRFHVRIVKGQPGGSGLGSSASSSGGTALAFHAMYPELALDAKTLVRAAASGERVAAGEHFDDVAAVVLGGLALVRARDDDLHLGRVQPPDDLHLAIVRPELVLPTSEMRRLVADAIGRPDLLVNLGNVAALIDAMHRGDVATVGACLEDRVAAPGRSTRMPYIDAVRSAARDAGAFGVTISGSGPSLLAVCDAAKTATEVARSMQDAVAATGVDAVGFAAEPERGIPHEVPLSRM